MPRTLSASSGHARTVVSDISKGEIQIPPLLPLIFPRPGHESNQSRFPLILLNLLYSVILARYTRLVREDRRDIRTGRCLLFRPPCAVPAFTTYIAQIRLSLELNMDLTLARGRELGVEESP